MPFYDERFSVRAFFSHEILTSLYGFLEFIFIFIPAVPNDLIVLSPYSIDSTRIICHLISPL